MNLDEGENWIVTLRKLRLKRSGWTGTLPEWLTASELLGENPLRMEPPITSLAAAKEHAEILAKSAL